MVVVCGVVAVSVVQIVAMVTITAGGMAAVLVMNMVVLYGVSTLAGADRLARRDGTVGSADDSQRDEQDYGPHVTAVTSKEPRQPRRFLKNKNTCAPLEHSALHDPLTGLPNRALLMDRLEAALARAVQTGHEVAVLFCDLDGFKRVNDTAGDAVLVETTRRILAVLREHDTVARIGGDEFVVIVEPWQREGALGQVDARSLAVTLAQRLAAELRQPTAVDGVEHVVTASIGITYAGAAAAQGDDVLRHADAAMYRAKHAGKDRFEVFEHGLRTDLAERRRVERPAPRSRALRGARAPRRPDIGRGLPSGRQR